MREIGIMINDMVEASKSLEMGVSMREITNIIRCMAKENIVGLVDRSMRVNGAIM